MIVQPCRIARCATGSFRSIQPFFFFPRSLFLFFTRTRTLEYARNTLPPLIRETSILLLGPRRYCQIAAMLPIRSSHYSPTRIGIGKDEPIHPFFPASMRFERDVVVVVACPTRYEILEIFSSLFDEVFCIIIF